jgi:hypothetical protein
MLSLANIQSTVAAAITAHSYFSNAPAIAAIVDDGMSKTGLETALRTKGFAVIVMPVLGVDLKDQGDGKTFTGDAELMVKIAVNPHVNSLASGAQRNVYAAIAAVFAAVLNWSPGPGDRRFKLTDNAVTISAADEGLLAYDLTFIKQITLN